jgi:hypothetical protein
MHGSKAAAQADRRMIVDAQIHLWKAESEDWKWVPGLKPQLPEPFTVERAIAMMDEAGVDRAVIVPATQLLGHRSHEFVCQGELPPAHQPIHRRAELLQRERQALGDGPRDRAAPELDVIGFFKGCLHVLHRCPRFGAQVREPGRTLSHVWLYAQLRSPTTATH